ncbi:MAG: hypothetical protein CMO01_18725 [Thalassobius sp.]|nr:hypothetical protein [Thalassovita sp.]|tara:strand:- start:11 stop:595 length:585 start_codon:yes stop_codon:yes gene_type:complete
MFDKFFKKPDENTGDRAEVVLLPQATDDMEEAKLIKWMVKVGSSVRKGDVLAEIQTDKVILELESYQNGTVLYLGAKEGSKVKVNSILAIIGDKGAEFQHLLGGEKSNTPAKKKQRPQLKGAIGEVKMFAGDFVPNGWLICDGRQLSIKEFPDLFETISYKFGGQEGENYHIPYIESKGGILHIICVVGEKVTT